MGISIRIGPAVFTWRSPHLPALCDEVTSWLVDRAVTAEHALTAEKVAHAHLVRCGDRDCGLYQVLVDHAVDAAASLIDEEMETGRG